MRSRSGNVTVTFREKTKHFFWKRIRKSSHPEIFEEATALSCPCSQRTWLSFSNSCFNFCIDRSYRYSAGMIRAFCCFLAHFRAPDSLALAGGISEALVNTAFGIYRIYLNHHCIQLFFVNNLIHTHLKLMKQVSV